ncbi:MAG: NADH:flavin oxidoreductase [Gammaproteobacteria bacterium]|nr:NADH:flavin oxidoreductase [Gammaproteobacteria bacterium]
MHKRDSRYDILFEPVQIGPVTARNRFYQVPHCTGLGWLRPRMVAELRGTKAEGGWGVVCTEYCSIHPGSDDLPHPYASLWDDGDIRAHALMTEKVHEHGGLAGAELWVGGSRSTNLFTREVAMDVNHMPNAVGIPFQARKMDKSDIREVRRWHRNAALRARQAGFDIVYVYATHHYMLAHFLNPKTNTRTDEYGGSLENRVRLVRELIEETKDAVGDTCAVAVRFSADEQDSDDEPIIGEHREMIEMLAELPDLWDINIKDYSREMGVSRFIREGSLEAYMSYVKSVTTKPVVSVGRFTSPDTMVSQVKRGIVDFIGAARPSIADPFLPKKIEEGRIDEIRECIGCNICYTGDSTGTPIRCTQNPTMSEEWRLGWHPEKIAPKGSDSMVLVVGGGPAGLEATRALGQRGYHVLLAEAEHSLGGRVSRESELPGLGEWARVRNYRVHQIQHMHNVDVYYDNLMDAEHVLAVEAQHIVIATGARWLANGRGLYNAEPLAELGPPEQVFTPDDIMAGRLPEGPTLIYDDDHYYMANVIAELLVGKGIPVTLVTPEVMLSSWGDNTGEQGRVQRRMMELGVRIITSHSLAAYNGSEAQIECSYTGNRQAIAAEAVVTVTLREPNDALYHELQQQLEGETDYRPESVTRIGDCEAPSIIAGAVYSGHRYARELDTEVDPDNRMKYDRVFFDDAQAKPGQKQTHPDYLDTLLRYYEEEINGESYFYGLAEHFSEREKTILLARAERVAAQAVEPLLEKYGLTPRLESDLLDEGREYVPRHRDYAWHEFMAYIVERYPDYLDDFKALEKMAPPEDLPALERLTEHEVVVIEFAQKELAGEPDSTAPLLSYLGES